MPLVPKFIVRHFSKPYVAGETVQDAVNKVRELNKSGVMATLDVLGEEVHTREKAREAVEQYKNLLLTIDREKLDSNISVKPTQFGLKVDYQFCMENIREVVALAKEKGNFVRIDMEDVTTTDQTLDMYRTLQKEFPQNVGVVLQAYLRRLSKDVDNLLSIDKPNFRLCKGIYIEKREYAYKMPEIINRNYTYQLEKLLGGGAYVGIATHDERLVYEGIRVTEQLKVKKEDYEFQMLLGVDPELRNIIVEQGHRLRVYVPFGKDWYPYCVRRLRENPQIAISVMKQMVGMK